MAEHANDVNEDLNARTVRELELDWEALAVAFENQLADSHSFLDLGNGSVHTINSSPGTVPEAPGAKEDYLYLQPRPSREGYRTMQRFMEQVEDPRLRETLTAALVGKGAFRRFKDALLDYPDVRQQWFAFKDAEVYSYIREWLAHEGILPTNDPPSGTIKERLFAVRPRPAERQREFYLKSTPRLEPGAENNWQEAIADYDRPGVIFNPARTALLVIDMQRVFAAPEGSSFLPAALPVRERLAELVEACRARRLPVIFTRHVHQDPRQDGGSMARWWSSLILEGSEDAELVDDLLPREDERVIVKCRYSAFAGTPLEMILHSLGISDVIVGGVMTNLCCETTARDAFNRDFNVFFLGDGTATAYEELHLSTLRNIAYGFGRVLSVSEALWSVHSR